MLPGSVRWSHGIQFKERMAVQKEALGSGETSHQWNNRDRGGRQRCNQLKLEWVRSATVSVANPALVWRVACDDSLRLFPSSHSHPTALWKRGQQLSQYLISPQLQPRWALNPNGVAQATHQHTLRSVTPPHPFYTGSLWGCGWPFLIVPWQYRESRELERDALFIVVMPSLEWWSTHNEAREENKRHGAWKGKQKNCVHLHMTWWPL